MKDIAKAEHLANSRVILFGLMAAFLLLQLWIGTGPGLGRAAIWAVTMLLYGMVISGVGGCLHNNRVRELLNDETTRSHRHSALMGGFWGGLIASSAIAVLSQAVAVDTYLATRIMTVSALVPALAIFAWRERQALRGV